MVDIGLWAAPLPFADLTLSVGLGFLELSDCFVEAVFSMLPNSEGTLFVASLRWERSSTARVSALSPGHGG